MARALVTGANGHVGANLVRELLERGWDVVGFVRETSDLRGLDGVDIELRTGDVLDRDSLVAAAAGCETIFHTAAVYRSWSRDPAEIMAPAVEGTRNAFAAARAAGAERIVYTSSIAAMGFAASADATLDEDAWHEAPVDVYWRAKTESERLAHALSEESGIPIRVVCPAAVIGRLDYRITPSTSLVKHLLTGGLPLWRGTYNFVSVRDVAAVHALVAERGRDGARYLAVGENFDATVDLGRALASLAGKAPTDLSWLPQAAVWFTGWMNEIRASITGVDPPYTRTFSAPGRYWSYDPSRTEAELGHTHRDLEACLQECIGWLLEIDALPPKVARRVRAVAAT